MADYYTQFSVLLPKVDSVKLAEFMASVEARHEAAPADVHWEIRPLDGMEYELRDGELWLYAEKDGHVAVAIDLIQEFLEHFDIDGGIYLSWACTCSKPSANESDGGAVVITRKETMWLGAYEVVNMATNAGIKVINAA